MMNIDVFENHWKNVRSTVRLHWLALTDADVKRIDGHIDVLIDLLREKYGYTQQLAEDEVNRFLQETGVGQAN